MVKCPHLSAEGVCNVWGSRKLAIKEAKRLMRADKSLKIVNVQVGTGYWCPIEGGCPYN